MKEGTVFLIDGSTYNIVYDPASPNGTSLGVSINSIDVIKSFKNDYEENLRRRQEEHLRNVYNTDDRNWRPCMHDSCPDCLGTGVKHDGSACIHYISCPCPKCSPMCY